MSLLGPQLQAFMAIYKHKTVHAAAASMCLTQTAVTQRIRGLERSLKTTLFIRSRRGMLLTQEGEALLRYCRASKELEGEALASIQGAGHAAEIEVSISAPTSMMRSRVIPSCLPVMKNFNNLLIHFDVEDVEQRHFGLRSGKFDLAIIREEHLAQEMKFKVLAPEQYVLVASPSWKGRRLQDIISNERIVDFNQEDHVTFDYLKQYDLFSLAKHGRYFVNRTDSLALLVSAGVGYTTLAKEFAMPYVDDNRLIILNKGRSHHVSSVLSWFDRPELPKYFSSILAAIC